MSLTTLGPDVIATKLYRYDRVYNAVASPADLGELHLQHYRDHGFVAVQNVFSADELKTYRQAISDVIAQGDPRMIQFERGAQDKNLPPAEREAAVRKCYNFVQFELRLLAMSRHPVLVGIIETLIGHTMRLIQDMALLKPPLVGREKPWHQDLAYFNVKPPELVIGTWTALDAATADNGCMHVIPDSHRAGAKPHYHDRDCQLNDEDVDVDRDTMVPLEPGGVLFFSALLHHGTPPNHSEARRRAVQLHYCATHCETFTFEEHEKLFRDSLGYAGCAGHHFGGHASRPVVGKPQDI